jgi:GNAT superfamily N-acetyltransferase
VVRQAHDELKHALFVPDEAVSTLRLRLNALDSAAIEPMSAWLETALAPDWRLNDLIAQVKAGNGALISDLDGAPIGAAIARLNEPAAHEATIPLIAIDPARRFRGLGGEAGLALEQHLRRRHAIERFYAPVPDGRGLAVYFWLRLGYRPLLSSESPGALIGLTAESRPGIWLVRDAE